MYISKHAAYLLVVALRLKTFIGGTILAQYAPDISMVS